MKSSKFLHRLLALAFCLILTVSLIPGGAQAVAPGNSNLTVNGLEQTPVMTVSAYQIITVSYNDGQPTEPMYSWNPAIEDWVTANYSTYIEADGSVSATFSALTSNHQDLNTFYDDLANAIRSGNPALSYAKQVTKPTGSTSCVLSDLPMGNYLILVEGGIKVYRPSTVNLIPKWQDDQWVLHQDTIELKSSDPTIQKTMTDQELKVMNANIGDTIPYTIVADIPTYPADAIHKTLKITDTLPTQLTLDRESIQVFLKTGDSQTPLSTGFTKTGEGNTFTLNFTYENINAADQVVVTYNGVLNETAVPAAAVRNHAVLEYSNNPYAEGTCEKDDDTEVYTYGIKLTKQDKVPGSSGAILLEGAQFNLSLSADNRDPIKFTRGDDGVYYPDADGSTALITGAREQQDHGKITIKGLKEGTYYLTEIQAPAGYIRLSTPVQVVLTPVESNPAHLDNPQEGEADFTEGYYPVTVENQKGYTLPKTGGVGTILFSAGGILMAGLGITVITLLLRRKRSA